MLNAFINVTFASNQGPPKPELQIAKINVIQVFFVIFLIVNQCLFKANLRFIIFLCQIKEFAFQKVNLVDEYMVLFSWDVDRTDDVKCLGNLREIIQPVEALS